MSDERSYLMERLNSEFEAFCDADGFWGDDVLDATHVRAVSILLATGGPHVEIVWVEGWRPKLMGAWGSAEVDRPLTPTETRTLIAKFGDFDHLYEVVADDA